MNGEFRCVVMCPTNCNPRFLEPSRGRFAVCSALPDEWLPAPCRRPGVKVSGSTGVARSSPGAREDRPKSRSVTEAVPGRYDHCRASGRWKCRRPTDRNPWIATTSA